MALHQKMLSDHARLLGVQSSYWLMLAPESILIYIPTTLNSKGVYMHVVVRGVDSFLNPGGLAVV